jgi:predicted TIM-barrel fold metal-dependent hydrolase
MQDQDKSLADLRLRDFDPEPMVRLPEHPVPKSPFPAVDMHNHLGKWAIDTWRDYDVAAMVDQMDACNLATVVNLDGGWGDDLERSFAMYDNAYPGRFVSFCRVDWDDCVNDGWEYRLAKSLRESVARGAAGWKIAKDLGLDARDGRGELILPDDPRLEPLWAAATECGIPVLMHTGDPFAFFRPLDRHNERVEELLNHPDWHFYGDGWPPLERYVDAMESTVATHPGITFIGAHVAFAEDTAWLDRMFSSYPNFNVDTGARIAELGRQPRAVRSLIMKHPTRMLLGTDAFPLNAENYAPYYRFFCTDDEYFPYSTRSGSGRWRIYGIGLPEDVQRLVLGDNARRIIPRLAAGHAAES